MCRTVFETLKTFNKKRKMQMEMHCALMKELQYLGLFYLTMK